MKKILTFLLIASAIILSNTIRGCYVSKNTADKSDAELWVENSNLCHNAPGPREFNNDNWDIMGTHMQVRTNLSKNGGGESDGVFKVVE